MKNKTMLAMVLASSLILSGCIGDVTQTPAPSDSQPSPTQVVGEIDTGNTVDNVDIEFEFSSRDQNASYDSESAILIELSDGMSAVSEDAYSIESDTLTIKSEGTYILSGGFTNGRIIIDAGDEKLQVVFDGVNINYDAGSAVFIKQADKVFITLAENSENTLSDGETYTDVLDNEDAVIFSKADLTINGDGNLTVIGNYAHGIVSKDDLVITGGNISVSAEKDALCGKDCVKIADAVLSLVAGSDGIVSSNADDEGRGYVYVKSGTINITAETDGIQAETVLCIEGGEIVIQTAGGAGEDATDLQPDVQQPANTTDPNEMSEGTPPSGDVPGEMPEGTPPSGDAPGEMPEGTPPGGEIPGEMPEGTPPGGDVPEDIPDANATFEPGVEPPTGGGGAHGAGGGFGGGMPGGMAGGTSGETDSDKTVLSDSAKGLKAGGSILISGGTISISALDDAIHSGGDAVISGGVIRIATGDDGIHADDALEISGGEINIIKSFEGAEGSNVTISGGTLYINSDDDGINAAGGGDETSTVGLGGRDNFADNSKYFVAVSGGYTFINSMGDGIDSNGGLSVSGGVLLISCTNVGDDSAIDYESGGVITGGTVIATGGTMQAKGFSNGSSQHSVSSRVNGSANTPITLCDADGNLIVSFVPAYAFDYIVISTPDMVSGQSYKYISGGTITGANADGYAAKGATISGGDIVG